MTEDVCQRQRTRRWQRTLIIAAFVPAVGIGIYQARQAANARGEVEMLRQEQAALSEQIQQATRERDKAVDRLAALRENNERLSPDTADLLKLRDEVAQLRKTVALQSSDPAYIRTKELLGRVDKIRQRLSETPAAMIPEMRFLKDRDYWEACRSSLDTEEDYLTALSSLRRAGERTFIGTLLQPALKRYAEANNGQFPTDLNQLRAYFASPVEDAILNRWAIVPAETVEGTAVGKTVITTKAPVDEDWDARYVVGLERYMSVGKTGSYNGWGVTNPNILLAPALQAAAESYKAANGGREPDGLSEAAPYLKLTTPEQRSAFEKLIQWSQKR